jgi:uncharacterized membrane protein
MFGILLVGVEKLGTGMTLVVPVPMLCLWHGRFYQDILPRPFSRKRERGAAV